LRSQSADWLWQSVLKAKETSENTEVSFLTFVKSKWQPNISAFLYLCIPNRGESQLLSHFLLSPVTLRNLQIHGISTSIQQPGQQTLETVAAEEVCPDAIARGHSAEHCAK
jgi:hypothetical protein